jgi:NADH-quinone oxidoreductase subunit M
MSFLSGHLLTFIVFVPMLGAILALAFPREEDSGVRGFAMAISLIDLVLTLILWNRFDPSVTGMQLAEEVSWIPTLGISYSVGIDGISILLVMLTAFLTPIVILSTYSSVTERAREYMVCLLFLQTGMLGAFVATDLFLFYVFWEVMLVPMYFLIGVWGGRRRIYAALKFFLYTMAGSLLMLVAIIYVVWAVRGQGGLSFSFAEVARRLPQTDLGGAELWLFLAFAVSFAIKVPMFPFHTWLPDAHVEAPTGGSVILAGVLLKLGTFGFLRYAMWLFPEAAASFMPALGLIAVIGIIYGALVSMVQTDLKRLIAFSSVSHLGFVMLGIAAMTVTGLSGGVLQMVNHGISTGALFLLVGVIYERRHTRLLDDFGGLAKVMPRYAAIFVLIALSSAGLPGLNGFVGEFLILMGAFQSQGATLSTPVSEFAWAGLIAVELVALMAVLLVAGAVTRRLPREQVWTRLAAVLFTLALALFLVAPPVGDFAGGVLVRPLLGPMQDGTELREVFAVLSVIAATGVIFAAVYLLIATQRVFFGPIHHPENEKLSDLSPRETLVLMPLVIVAILMGLFPQPFLKAVNPTVTAYAQQFRQRAGLPALASNAPRPVLHVLEPGAPAGGPPAGLLPAEGDDLQRRLQWRRQGGRFPFQLDKPKGLTMPPPQSGTRPAARPGAEVQP